MSHAQEHLLLLQAEESLDHLREVQRIDQHGIGQSKQRTSTFACAGGAGMTYCNRSHDKTTRSFGEKMMILSLGWWRNTIAPACNIQRVTPEIIQCDCPECDGTGLFFGHPEFDSLPCVACKGTGRIYA